MSDDGKYRVLLKRVLISQAAVVVIALVSLIGFQVLSAQKPDVQARDVTPEPLNIDSYAADRVTFDELITAYGTARPDREVVIAAEVSGTIVSVHPHLEIGLRVTAPVVPGEGDTVAEAVDGDTLVQIDQRDYINRSQQATNRINEAGREIEQLHQQQANSERVLEKAKTDVQAFQEEYDRNLKAVELRAGARAELNRALVELQRHRDSIVRMENQISLYPHQIAAAEERLSTSRSEAQRAEDDLQRTTVMPPFNGVLSEVMVEQGQFVRAGEPLVRLTDPNLIEVPVAIRLGDWRQLDASVRGGQTPEVWLATSESAPDRWEGEITRVAPEADPGSRTILVFVEVQNSKQQHGPLLPGTFVHARITVDENSDHVVIPRSAILNEHVYVVESDMSIRRQRVEQGRQLRSLVVIDSGLKGGEQIAVTNLTLLEDGQQVTVQQTTNLVQEMQQPGFPLLKNVETDPQSSTPEDTQEVSSRPAARE